MLYFRSQGMGLLQISSRIGAAGAPWVAKGLKDVHEYAPFLVMGVSSLIASFLMIRLPETKGQKTAEVIETTHTTEFEMLGENKQEANCILANDGEGLSEERQSTKL